MRPKSLADPDHRDLDHVGGRSLQRRIDGRALRKSPQIWIATLDIWNGSHAAEQRAHPLRYARLFEQAIDELANPDVPCKVRLNVELRLRLRNVEVRSESKGRDAVHNAEVHGLRAIACLLAH